MTLPAFGLGTFRLKDDVVIASVKTALERAIAQLIRHRSMKTKLPLDKLSKRAVYRVMSCSLPRKSGLRISAKTSLSLA